MARIAYGVHGYSRGHATRALAVLPDLSSRHDVRVYAGGDAFEALRAHFDVEQIPTMRYFYHRGRRSALRTVCHNLPYFWELIARGRSVRVLCERLARFAPDVVISDAESWTHTAARQLGIPRIGFDHFGMMVHCKLELSARDWLESLVDRFVYGLLAGRPERVLISSFYELEARRAGIEIIPPLLREAVHAIEPSSGEHLLVYLNQGNVQLTKELLLALGRVKLPVRLYGTGRTGRAGSVSYRPASETGFLRDLASCRAVVSTAGNQLVGEALRFGKPMLVVPEATVEQRMNARAIASLGIGEMTSFERFGAPRILEFLGRLDRYTEKARTLSVDGRPLALKRLNHWVHELALGPTHRALGRFSPAAVEEAS